MTRVAYITGHAARTHVAIIEGLGPIPGEILALTVDPDLEDVRNAKEFECLGCKGKCSAVELHKESDVPGECLGCADEFFCPHGMHPDDECDKCEAEAAVKPQVAQEA